MSRRPRPGRRRGGAPLPQLVREGRAVAPVELATSLRDRARGLLGRDGIEGALLLSPASSVHTLGMRFAIDVAFCDARLRARHVVEAEAGRFARWGLRRGDRLEVRA